jgi:hypothetical protein
MASTKTVRAVPEVEPRLVEKLEDYLGALYDAAGLLIMDAREITSVTPENAEGRADSANEAWVRLEPALRLLELIDILPGMQP